MNNETIIEHFENGVQRFSNDVDFVKFCQCLFNENEGNDTTLKKPDNYSDALEYLRLYCDSFVVIDFKTNER